MRFNSEYVEAQRSYCVLGVNMLKLKPLQRTKINVVGNSDLTWSCGIELQDASFSFTMN